MSAPQAALVTGSGKRRVGWHVADALAVAQVGQPVPAEQALAADDQPVAVGCDRLQESALLGRHFLVQDDQASLVEDAQVHGPGVQIDATVESVLLVVESHHGLLGYGWGLSPHRGWPTTRRA